MTTRISGDRTEYVTKVLRNVLQKTGGDLRVSQRGVPHIVTHKNTITISICFFARSGTFRVFWPWGVSLDQEHKDFRHSEEIVDWIMEFN